MSEQQTAKPLSDTDLFAALVQVKQVLPMLGQALAEHISARAIEIERLERQLANQAALIHALRQPDEPVDETADGCSRCGGTGKEPPCTDPFHPNDFNCQYRPALKTEAVRISTGDPEKDTAHINAGTKEPTSGRSE